MNKEEIEKMELEYTNAIRKRIENAMKCEIGLDAVSIISLNVNGEIEDVLEIEECKDLLDILLGEDNEDNK